MRRIRINAENGSYDVCIGEGLIERAGELARFPRMAIVTEENVAPLYLEKLRASLEAAGVEVFEKVLPAGEQTKCMQYLMEIYEFLLESKLRRSDAVAALGGGVIGDLAGFAAATSMRGIGFVQIPTSLLAQVDSSVGGKVAIDFGGAKNMVGSFYQPDIVLADTGALATLPERQFRAGMAEVVKYAAIADESLINTIESGDVAQMVTRCVQIKADVVEQDPLDKGVRALLNFGHTAGHSVESLSDFSLLHGEAVAVGMSIMTRVGEYMGETETGTAERLDAIMKAQGLDTRCSYSAEDIVAQMGMDKKAEADGVRAVLISRIGDAHTRHMTSEEMLGYVRRALEAQKKD